MNNPCPKCHQQWAQEGPLEPIECPKCGVIFAKFYAAQEQKLRLEAEREARAKVEAESRRRTEEAKAASEASRQAADAKAAEARAEKNRAALLSTCPACGGTVAIGAKACPHCGKDDPAPAPKKKKEVGRGGIALALLLLIAILYAVSSRPTGGGSASLYDAFNAQAECEKFVSRRLKAPSSASFASFRELRISGSGDGPWTVVGWVDADNAFGAKLRKTYVCEVQFADGRAKLLNLSID